MNLMNLLPPNKETIFILHKFWIFVLFCILCGGNHYPSYAQINDLEIRVLPQLSDEDYITLGCLDNNLENDHKVFSNRAKSKLMPTYFKSLVGDLYVEGDLYGRISTVNSQYTTCADNDQVPTNGRTKAKQNINLYGVRAGDIILDCLSHTQIPTVKSEKNLLGKGYTYLYTNGNGDYVGGITEKVGPSWISPAKTTGYININKHLLFSIPTVSDYPVVELGLSGEDARLPFTPVLFRTWLSGFLDYYYYQGLSVEEVLRDPVTGTKSVTCPHPNAKVILGIATEDCTEAGLSVNNNLEAIFFRQESSKENDCKSSLGFGVYRVLSNNYTFGLRSSIQNCHSLFVFCFYGDYISGPEPIDFNIADFTDEVNNKLHWGDPISAPSGKDLPPLPNNCPSDTPTVNYTYADSLLFLETAFVCSSQPDNCSRILPLNSQDPLYDGGTGKSPFCPDCDCGQRINRCVEPMSKITGWEGLFATVKLPVKGFQRGYDQLYTNGFYCSFNVSTSPYLYGDDIIKKVSCPGEQWPLLTELHNMRPAPVLKISTNVTEFLTGSTVIQTLKEDMEFNSQGDKTIYMYCTGHTGEDCEPQQGHVLSLRYLDGEIYSVSQGENQVIKASANYMARFISDVICTRGPTAKFLNDMKMEDIFSELDTGRTTVSSSITPGISESCSVQEDIITIDPYIYDHTENGTTFRCQLNMSPKGMRKCAFETLFLSMFISEIGKFDAISYRTCLVPVILSDLEKNISSFKDRQAVVLKKHTFSP